MALFSVRPFVGCVSPVMRPMAREQVRERLAMLRVLEQTPGLLDVCIEHGRHAEELRTEVLVPQSVHCARSVVWGVPQVEERAPGAIPTRELMASCAPFEGWRPLF